MRITAHFGTAMLASAVPAPKASTKPSHPIVTDTIAIETALATLIRLAKREAISRGLTPELDLAAQQFRAEHGPLAGLIADPVTEAICYAASVLTLHLQAIVPLDQQPACAARLAALSGPETRYGADTRPRH